MLAQGQDSLLWRSEKEANRKAINLVDGSANLITVAQRRALLQNRCVATELRLHLVADILNKERSFVIIIPCFKSVFPTLLSLTSPFLDLIYLGRSIAS